MPSLLDHWINPYENEKCSSGVGPARGRCGEEPYSSVFTRTSNPMPIRPDRLLSMAAFFVSEMSLFPKKGLFKKAFNVSVADPEAKEKKRKVMTLTAPDKPREAYAEGYLKQAQDE